MIISCISSCFGPVALTHKYGLMTEELATV